MNQPVPLLQLPKRYAEIVLFQRQPRVFQPSSVQEFNGPIGACAPDLRRQQDPKLIRSTVEQRTGVAVHALPPTNRFVPGPLRSITTLCVDIDHWYPSPARRCAGRAHGTRRAWELKCTNGQMRVKMKGNTNLLGEGC